jgi:hypothetical protein
LQLERDIEAMAQVGPFFNPCDLARFLLRFVTQHQGLRRVDSESDDAAAGIKGQP